MTSANEVLLSHVQRLGPRTLRLQWSNGVEEIVSLAENGIWWVTRDGRTECYSEKSLKKLKLSDAFPEVESDFHSPVTGRLVWKKDEGRFFVKKGESILVLESMKMQTSVQASRDGYVDLSSLTAGQLVAREQLLFRIFKD